MAIFLLSLTGIPPLAGFAAKYMVFAAGIDAGYTWLVILGLLMAVVSLYYYANVMKQMYFTKNDSAPVIKLHPAAKTVLVIGVAGLLVFGIFPGPVIDFVKESATLFALP